MQEAIKIIQEQIIQLQKIEQYFDELGKNEIHKKIPADAAKEEFSGSRRLLQNLLEKIKASHKQERFKKPTDKQLVDFALIFNDGRIEEDQLANMVGMCSLIIDRLHENGDVSIPTLEENKAE